MTIENSFFKRMIDGEWSEAMSSGSPIFIDRDFNAFPIILSFLRSQRLCIDETTSDSLLQKAVLEAEFYSLDVLSVLLREQIQIRSRCTIPASKEVYKSISPAEMNSHFERGWSFVSAFQTDATTACNKSDKKVPATVQDSRCSACGDRLEYRSYR